MRLFAVVFAVFVFGTFAATAAAHDSLPVAGEAVAVDTIAQDPARSGHDATPASTADATTAGATESSAASESASDAPAGEDAAPSTSGHDDPPANDGATSTHLPGLSEGRDAADLRDAALEEAARRSRRLPNEQ
jgi:hypothetical protein